MVYKWTDATVVEFASYIRLQYDSLAMDAFLDGTYTIVSRKEWELANWRKVFEEWLATKGRKIGPVLDCVYFITFTYNPSCKYSKEEFKKAVEKQLKRGIFSSYKHVFEHEDSNIHAHALVHSKHRLNKDNFKSHARKYGYVDIKSVKEDNGIEEYLTKENPLEGCNHPGADSKEGDLRSE